MRHKNKLASYSNLSDIIKALDTNDHCDSMWVGKNYTKGQLIRDLSVINVEYIKNLKLLTAETVEDKEIF